MSQEELALEELAEELGIDNQLMEDLEAKEMKEEKRNVLEEIIETYLKDREQFEQFAAESGLQDLLAKLDDVEIKEIETEEDITELKQEVEEKAAETEIDLEVDL